jgi:hypothetical protein
MRRLLLIKVVWINKKEKEDGLNYKDYNEGNSPR